ncbi:MAG TPA: AtpZ/AtpI family protein [Candidatus Binatia bacterium]
MTANQPDRDPGKVDLPFAKYAKYLAIGLEIPSAIVGSLIVGYLIDRWLGTSPWVTIVASVAGFVGAVVRLTQYLKYFSDDKRTDKNDES